jgi:GxxExxY protein
MTQRIIALAEEALTRSIIGAFYEVYRILGFGYLEGVYVEALARELRRRGHTVEREALIKVWYKGEVIARQRVDMLVDGKIILEVKSGLSLPPTGSRQLCNCLKGSEKEVGLLLHFGPEPRYFREYSPNRPVTCQSHQALSVPSGTTRQPLPAAMPFEDTTSPNGATSKPGATGLSADEN